LEFLKKKETYLLLFIFIIIYLEVFIRLFFIFYNNMGNAISKTNKDYINKNWNKLKCTPIGPLLQIIKVAPGDVTTTSNECKSNSFSSQFNSSMTDNLNITKKLSGGLNIVHGTLDKFRKIIATIQQQAFKDLSRVATLIFSLYVKIGNIFFVITQQLVNILNIFKSTVNTTAAIAKLLVAFINLIRLPFNFVYGVVEIISGILKPLVWLTEIF